MRALTEAVRFLCELAVLVGVGVAGADVAWPFAIVPPAALALVWGRWVAPRAPRRLPDPGRLALEVVLFAAAGLAVAATISPAGGAVLATVGIATSLATRHFEAQGSGPAR